MQGGGSLGAYECGVYKALSKHGKKFGETKFFKTRTDYPPEREDETLVAYTLTITVGANAHTTGWTDVSKDMPDSIIKIVNVIKKIVSKEKIV
jgi:hypothetical protein